MDQTYKFCHTLISSMKIIALKHEFYPFFHMKAFI